MTKLVLLPLVVLGCLSSPAEEPPGPPTPALLQAYGNDAELSCELHRALTAGDPSANAFFSPTSIAAALSMLAEGARGDTRAEFAQALQGSDELDLGSLRALRADLAHRLRVASHDIQWREANGIWVDDQAVLLEATQQALQAYHSASIEPADFRGSSEQVRKEINGWVEQRTNGKIAGLMPSGSVDSMTRLVLANAVYFIGNWEEEFEVKGIKRPFTRVDGTQANVPFLMDTRELPAAFFGAWDELVYTDEEAALTAFELPYRGGQLSFVGLIPSTETGLPALEKRLSGPLLKQWLGALRKQKVRFAMPKLELEPSYDLIPVLKSLGLDSVLDPNTADLSGFFGQEGAELCVTSAVHKAFLRVDEKGTEAAAATGAAMFESSAMRLPPRVHADRPYLFLIRERSTDAILFMGRVMNP